MNNTQLLERSEALRARIIKALDGTSVDTKTISICYPYSANPTEFNFYMKPRHCKSNPGQTATFDETHITIPIWNRRKIAF